MIRHDHNHHPTYIPPSIAFASQEMADKYIQYQMDKDFYLFCVGCVLLPVALYLIVSFVRSMNK